MPQPVILRIPGRGSPDKAVHKEQTVHRLTPKTSSPLNTPSISHPILQQNIRKQIQADLSQFPMWCFKEDK